MIKSEFQKILEEVNQVEEKIEFISDALRTSLGAMPGEQFVELQNQFKGANRKMIELKGLLRIKRGGYEK